MNGNASQLIDLRQKADDIARNLNSKPASNDSVATLAQIVADLIDIVHSNAYRHGDPGQP